jgi:hypothetical protein
MSMNNYLKYLSLNSFFTSISAVIATNSMLNSIVDKPSYTSTMTTTYIGKDIIGQLGGILYSLKTGRNADKTPLKYITTGFILQQTAFAIENFAPMITNKDIILPLLGVSSCLKNISFITIGAVNATNLQKISPENIGKFYSQVASFNTLSSSLGMIVGIGILNYEPGLQNKNIFMFLSGLGSFYYLRKSTKI